MRELEFIGEVLADLSPFLLDRFRDRSALTISKKSGLADLVTEADIEAQRRIEAAITKAFPGDVLVGEESGKDRPPANANARCWVCDPIDGTHNFARGLIPAWGDGSRGLIASNGAIHSELMNGIMAADERE